jgi:glycosyltransferase involved in cell wall biosynthesis
LAKRGHQIYVLTSNYQANQITESEPEVKRILHLESPDHVHYHPYYTLLHRWWERQNRYNLIKTVTQFTPDVIFINGMWNLPVSVALTAERLLPGRVVYYIASYWPTELDAHTAYWQNVPEPDSSWRKMAKRWLGKLANSTLVTGTPRNQLDFRLVLCVSEFMQNGIIEKANVPSSQTHVVYNGIDPNIFSMQNLEPDGITLRLLYAGRLSPDKGVHTVIEALGLLRQNQSSLPIKFSVVGSGVQAYEAQLKKQTAELGLAEIIHFQGQVPREQMPIILAEHNALILPSIWPEPLARMTQEAMACGLVVIGTTTGGTPEILYDGENGLTFEAGNASMLADKIALVANNPSLRVALARAARCTIEEQFTMKRMIDEVEYYLTSVIKEQVLE